MVAQRRRKQHQKTGIENSTKRTRYRKTTSEVSRNRAQKTDAQHRDTFQQEADSATAPEPEEVTTAARQEGRLAPGRGRSARIGAAETGIEESKNRSLARHHAGAAARGNAPQKQKGNQLRRQHHRRRQSQGHTRYNRYSAQ